MDNKSDSRKLWLLSFLYYLPPSSSFSIYFYLSLLSLSLSLSLSFLSPPPPNIQSENILTH